MKHHLILVAIVLLAFFIRFYRVDSIPLSLHRDEAGLGYDAYSILYTGRDQYSSLLPLILRSSDDYKLAGFAYLTIPPLALFGLTPMATRLTSVILGSITVVLVYFLTMRIISSEGCKKRLLSLASSFILAVMPWHIQYSRIASESNAGLFFLTSGTLGLIYSPSSIFFLIISVLLFGIGMHTYHSLRFIAPIIVLVFLFSRKLQFPKKSLIVLSAFFCISFVLTFPSLLKKETNIRMEVLNLFMTDNQQNQNFKTHAARVRADDHKRNAGFSGSVVHNHRLATIQYENIADFLKNALSYISPNFLLFSKDERILAVNHAPGYGLLHVWQIVFLYLTFFFLPQLWSRRLFFLLSWVLAVLIQGAISIDSPNSWRALALTVPWAILTAYGIRVALKSLERKQNHFSVFLLGIFTLTASFTIFVFLHQYFVHLNIERAEDWRYGRKETALFADAIKENYEKVIVSSLLDDPYLYFLFYLRYDPNEYLRRGGTVSGGWTANKNHFDKYFFRPIDFNSDKEIKGQLLIGLPEEFPDNATFLKKIYYPNGKEAIRIVKT